MVVPLVNTTVVKFAVGIAEIAVVGIVAVAIVQPSNPSLPMVVTESGIVTHLRLEQ